MWRLQVADAPLIDSIKDVAGKVAKQLVAQYAKIDGKNIDVLGGYPGILYEPYYWWQAGAMMGTLLDYWHYTGDDQYNELVREALIHQMGEHQDLVPTPPAYPLVPSNARRCPPISLRTKETMTKSSGPFP
jgi:predicted Zn-dependent protease with MMP-like domain